LPATQPDDFDSLFDLEDWILVFHDRDQQAAKPIEWKFTRTETLWVAGQGDAPAGSLIRIRPRPFEPEDASTNRVTAVDPW
jgi:hypothetical protein